MEPRRRQQGPPAVQRKQGNLPRGPKHQQAGGIRHQNFQGHFSAHPPHIDQQGQQVEGNAPPGNQGQKTPLVVEFPKVATIAPETRLLATAVGTGGGRNGNQFLAGVAVDHALGLSLEPGRKS